MAELEHPPKPARRERVSRKVLVREFLRCFCACQWDELAPLLSEDVRVQTPFGHWQGREAYMQALQAQPPLPCCYSDERILSAPEQAMLFFSHHKPAGPQTVAVMFRFRGAQICALSAVFDARESQSHRRQTLNAAASPYAGV